MSLMQPTPTRVRLAAGAMLSAAFLGGLALGYGLDRGVAQATPGELARTDDRRGDFAPPPSGWIIDRLGMSDAQRVAVDSIIAHFASHMGELQREYRPRFQTVVDSANRAVRDVLTAEQLAQYDSLQTAVRSRRMRGNPPGPR
ncbi:MAG: hypothetical protein WD804_04715 [Gemmatimonadota bacterium]